VAEQTVPPETSYAQLGRDRLAYQVLGQGPPDLVFTMGSFSHVDMVWDDPQVALFLRRLASFSRLLRFDPGAKLVELEGDLPMWWDQQEVVLGVVEEFLVGARRAVEAARVLATVLFTDIVGSTERAAELGDRDWRDLLDTHDELAGRLVERWGGRLVKTTGDGILASFDGPGRAIGCAATLRDELRGIGTQIRAGLHTGEVELRGDDLGGIAVHIAARIMAAAGAGEIVVSRTVRDLVAGSDITLQARGSQRLKGVEGEWELFTVLRR
jgi:class 3 adenylate cyclase